MVTVITMATVSKRRLSAAPLCLSVLLCCVHNSYSVDIVADYNSDTVVNHLAVDTASGNIYAGAINRVYQLNANLTVLESDVTGPQKDNPLCSHPDGDSCTTLSGKSVDTRDTDNINKVLVVDRQNDHLITCGSVLQGICQVRNLRNISGGQTYRGDTGYFVAANDPTSSTVAFLGPGSSSQMLYVGASFTTDGQDSAIRVEVPAVSGRSTSGNMLKVERNALLGVGTFLKFTDQVRDTYIVNYITGFNVGGYSYFLTTQRQTTESQNYVSKIVQVCQNDPQFRSYVEIRLVCRSQTTTYNLVQSAVVAEPGSDLANFLAITNTENLLIATFSTSQSENSDTPSSESAVCVYKLSDIRTRMTENIQRCFGGQGRLGAHLAGDQTCDSIVSMG